MRRLGLKQLVAVFIIMSIVVADFMLPHTILASNYTATVNGNFCQTEARSMLSMLNKWRIPGHDCRTVGDTGMEFWGPNEALSYDYDLELIAMQRAAETVLVFDHKRPDGRDIDTIRINNITTNGENIAAGYDTLEEVFDSWVEEDETYAYQGHRRNMLDSRFTRVGIACFEYNGKRYWVQEFGIGDNPHGQYETPALDGEKSYDINFADNIIPETLGAPGGYWTGDFTLYYGVSRDIFAYDNFRICRLRGDLIIEDVTDKCEFSWHLVDEEGIDHADKLKYDGKNFNIYTLGNYVFTGEASYNGIVTDANREYKLTIVPAHIIQCTITCDKEYEYTGSQVKPTVIVENSGVELVEGVDYKLVYNNNVEVSSEYPFIVVEGMGNYQSFNNVFFSIVPADLSKASVEGVYDCKYDSNGITFNPVVFLNGKVVNPSNYMVTYINNTSVGTGSVIITGVGSFGGTKVVPFRIYESDINDAEITEMPVSVTYTGTEIKPVPTLILGDRELIYGTDYEVYYENNLNVGEATVTIEGLGYFAGSATTKFFISKKSITGASVTWSEEAYIYSEDGLKPVPTVTCDGITLKYDEDYSVVYPEEIVVGSNSVIISGKGNYAGTVTGAFEVVSKSLEGAVISPVDDCFYTGSSITPVPVVTLDGVTLINGVDYHVTYKKNTMAGDATITINGIGNYDGTISTTFRIIKKSITESVITVNGDDYEYTGNEIIPYVKVTLDGEDLIQDRDYKISFENNTNAGTATIIVEGNGLYGEVAESSFTIKPASIKEATFISSGTPTYSGEEVCPSFFFVFGGKVLNEDTDYVIENKGINAGEAVITFKGNGNFTDSFEYTYEILPSTIEDAVVSFTGNKYVYNGTEINPGLVVKLGDLTLTSDVDYKAEFTNNINAGQAKVSITGIGNYEGHVDSTFVIEQANLSRAVISNVSPYVEYTGEPIECEPEVTFMGKVLKADEDYVVTYKDNTNMGIATVTINGINNYQGSIDYNFIISEQLITNAVVTGLDNIVYTGKPVDVVPTVVLEGKELINGVDFTYFYRDDINAGTSTLNITGKGNYAGTLKKTFEIKPLSLSDAEVNGIPERLNFTGSDITPVPVVVVGDVTLIPDKDYVVIYSNNRNEGTAEIVINGIGNYEGTIRKTFTIKGVPTPEPTEEPTIEPTPEPTSDVTPTPADTNKTGVEGFAERLYTCALDRSSDPNGMKTWVNVLTSGEMNGAEVASGFFFSKEFIDSNISDEEFVIRLYKTFMDRSPDQGGFDMWTKYLKDGHSRQEVFRGFVDSKEWANVCYKYGIASGGNATPDIELEPTENIIAFATRLYTTCLCREPDEEGVNNWSNYLANHKVTGSEAARSFFFSNEFLSHEYNDEVFVDRLYMTFMGREADVEGRAMWIDLLKSGKWNREMVFDGFANSLEFEGICQSYGISR